MKKINIALAALVALFSSCSESISDFFDANHGTELTATMPSAQPIHTRTAYEIVDNSQEPLQVTWEEQGEKLYSVCTSADAGQLNGGVLEQTAVSADKKSATFKAGYTLAAGQLFAFYAGHDEDMQSTFEDASGNSSVTATLKFDGQTGKYKDLVNYDYMTASVDNVKPDGKKFKMGTLALQHEVAVVVLKKDMVLRNVGAATKVSKVELQGVPTTGTLKVSRSGDALTSSIASGSTGTIAINDVNVAITDNKLADDIYIATLPVNSLANLKVKMTYDNNTSYTYTYSGTANKLEKGIVYDWTPVSDFGISAQAVDFHIEGIVMQKGIIMDANGLASTLSAVDGSKSETPQVQIVDNKWYSDEACTQALSSKPAKSTAPVYAKYKLLNDPKYYDAKAERIVTLTRTESATSNKDVVAKEVTLPDYAEMKFTIKTTSANQSFSVPFPTGDTSAKLAIVWGGNESTLTANTNELSSITEATRKHTYAATGTYQIRILSLQTDATKKQIPEFNFSQYPSVTGQDKTTLSGSYNYNSNGEMLISMDSPVLNSGVTNLYGMFYGTANLASVDGNLLMNYPNATNARDMFFCSASKTVNKALKTIPATLFKYNTKLVSLQQAFGNCQALESVPAGLFDKNIAVTSFVGTFRNCSALKTIPKGLFDKNISVTTFDWLFCGCTSLETAPAGLFAYNAKATVFSSVFQNCYMLKLTDDIFITDAITQATRFASAPDKVDFSNAFNATGKNRGSDKGTAPDLWNYTYAYGCGFYDKYTVFYTGTSGQEPTYYTNTIPSAWYKTTNKSGFCYLKKN